MGRFHILIELSSGNYCVFQVSNDHVRIETLRKKFTSTFLSKLLDFVTWASLLWSQVTIMTPP
jgi:hypothetical protein